jgi:hypothetical protein
VPPSGKIWFGTDWAKKSGALVIVGKKSHFHASGQIAWVAHFDQNAGASSVTVELYSVQSAGKTPLSKQPSPTSSNTNEKALRIAVSNLINAGANRAGRYGIQYSHGSHTLASGDFFLTK